MNSSEPRSPKYGLNYPHLLVRSSESVYFTIFLIRLLSILVKLLPNCDNNRTQCIRDHTILCELSQLAQLLNKLKMRVDLIAQFISNLISVILHNKILNITVNINFSLQSNPEVFVNRKQSFYRFAFILLLIAF